LAAQPESSAAAVLAANRKPRELAAGESKANEMTKEKNVD
jgi:hypothetical protein